MTDFAGKKGSLDTQNKTNEKTISAFFPMYVIDYISNPGIVKLATLNKYKSLMEVKDGLKTMPIGTIFAIKLSGGNLEGEDIKIVLPFFSSHMSQPIKAGEVVWSMQDENGQCFYLSRKHSIIKYEDVNYTANLRNKKPKPSTKDSDSKDKFDAGKVAEETGEPPVETSSASFSFPQPSQKPTPALATALTLSTTDSNAYFKGEAIPRHKTKPPDFSIQGSNNTLIELGTDLTTGKQEGVGVIHVVVGLGQGEETKAVPAKNSRNFNETDKESTKQNMSEGTYDYIKDSSRIIVSMNSDIDKDFKIGVWSLDEDLPLNTSYSMSTGAEEKVLPAIVLKSTNQLMIGRAEGTVRIVHESGSSIVMDENGNIQIQCSQEGQIRIGSDNASVEPAVLGEKLNEMILAVVTEMIAMAPSFVATGVGPGVLAPTILTALSEFQGKLTAKEILSKIIKVE